MSNETIIRELVNLIGLDRKENTEIEPLRNRGELEKELAAQIAIGAIPSVEIAERKGNLDALEYSAQMLFDDVRKRISQREKLPDKIAFHLMRDRNEEVKFTAMRNNWGIASKDMLREFFRKADEVFVKGPHVRLGSVEVLSLIASTFTLLETRYIDNRRDDILSRLYKLRRYGSRIVPNNIKGADFMALRDLPKSVEVLITPEEDLDDEAKEMQMNTLDNLQLIHPDESIRCGLVKKITEMKVGELKSTFCSISCPPVLKYDRSDHIKTRVLGILATDPSAKVRRIFLNSPKMNWVPVLEYMAENDPDKLVQGLAQRKLDRAKKRAAYAKRYHAKKDNN